MTTKKLTKKEIEELYGDDPEKIRKKLMMKENEPIQRKENWIEMIKRKLSKKIIRRK